MTLQKGSQGLEVVSLQIRLNKLGYNLVEDGDFGPGTEKAVKQFQTNVNLYPDGVVGSFTMAALESEIIKNTAPPELDYKKLYLELKENIRKLVI
jgi:peptidoglycan hydrolase-like protein with peptidoglycan-binding domain